ncbi:hypothetical protein TMEC54S_00113 [Thauera mechernichensis]|uniref:S24 family peptidase n=1 Tax=Thauera sp. 27 TaxID=305700 RepID=UPI0002D10D84|nr:S24 family peptidase [Thauera sp. 27]ENO77572.1 hypothetical protein B447_15471 [Thauera sp. 27]
MTITIQQQFSINLNALLDEAGVPASGFGRSKHVATSMDVGVATAGKWLSGKQIPEYDRLERMKEWLGCSFDDLLGRTEARGGRIPARAENVLLNMVGTRSATRISICPDEPASIRSDGVYALPIEGDVMSPYVVDGDMVCFMPAMSAHTDGVYVIHVAERYIVRRVNLTTRGTVKLIAENARYEAEEVDLAEEVKRRNGVRIVGVVCARILVNR